MTHWFAHIKGMNRTSIPEQNDGTTQHTIFQSGIRKTYERNNWQEITKERKRNEKAPGQFSPTDAKMETMVE